MRKPWKLAIVAAVLAALLAAPAFASLSGVRLISFSAVRMKSKTKKPSPKVVVKWRTGSEPSILGFNLYRVVGTKQTKLGRSAIPSTGAAAGASYSYTDTLPKTVKLACYSLETVDTAGAKAPLANTCMKK